MFLIALLTFGIAAGNTVLPVAAKGSESKQSQMTGTKSKKRTKITVKYNANGGKVSPKKKTVYYGAAYGTLKKPTREGYTFKGWYTKKKGGSKVTFRTKVSQTKNHILYAHWSKRKYKIVYKLDGGVNDSHNPASYSVTSRIVLRNPTKKGYTFEGWYSDSEYKNKVTVIAKGSTGRKKLYAKWVAESYAVPITDLVSISDTPKTTTKLTDNYGNQYNYAVINNHGYNGSAGPLQYEYLANSKYSKFCGTIYIPQGETSDGVSSLIVKGDGHVLYASPAVNKRSQPINIDVNVSGCNNIKIIWSNNSGYNNISSLQCCLANACFYTSSGNDEKVDLAALPVALTDLTSIYSGVRSSARLVDNRGNTYSSAVYNRIDNLHNNNIPIYEYLLDSRYSRFECTLYVPTGVSFSSPVVMTAEIDGKTVYTSSGMTGASEPVQVKIDISGGNDFKITFSEGSWNDSSSSSTLCLGNPYLYLK